MPDTVHDHDPGVRLTNDEWSEVVRILFPAPNAAPTPAEVWEQIRLAALTSREPHAVNLDYLRECAAALIRAGLPGGCDVPPSDLPGKIKTLGEMRAQAEHTARTLAGEVAALTTRLEENLPAVFGAVLDELAAGPETGTALLPDDIRGAGSAALVVTLRILDEFDVRDREDTRPADTPCQRRDVYRQPCRLSAGHDGFCEPSPTPAEEPLTVNLWGVPVDADHPAVLYLAMHLGALTGCDGSPGCRRSLIAATLHEAAVDCRNRGVPSQSRSEDPSDEWIRRTAERLADLTSEHTLAALARLIRDAIERARVSIIDSRIPADG